MTKFISFYSYKGGVGSTLTLVNVAAALAKEGKSVIIWDLDLEAPGIQTFPLLDRFGIEEEVKTGTVDIILNFQENNYQLKNDQIIRDSIYSFKSQKLTGVYKPLKNIRILPAGKLDEEYPAKYSQIKWDQLFDGKKNTGLEVFEWCYHVMADMNPDVVLVDSRAGLTNISLVTTVQVPDMIYLVFNYNQQNLRGLHSIYKALISPVIQQDIRNFTFPVFPVASMVDFENIKLHQRRKKVLAEQYNIEPEYEIPFHKPLIMEEDILSITDEHQTLEATKIYYEIAYYISSFEPERLEKKKPLKEKKT